MAENVTMYEIIPDVATLRSLTAGCCDVPEIEIEEVPLEDLDEIEL